MRIRELELPGLTRLAPMANISNAPFRLITRECGSAFSTTEEIDAMALVRGNPKALHIASSYPGEHPLAMQLLGADAATLVPAAEMLAERGAEVIDLNMGCPVRKIVSAGKGAALMRDIPRTARLLRAMRAAIRVPFTVKIRGGWDDEHLNAVDVARMAEDEGVDAITVHPRTRSQQFSGKAPWDVIREVVEAVRIPVTGNGDVRSLKDARAMQASTGCAAVMVGRGALGRPWIFDEAYACLPACEQRAYRTRVIQRHIALIKEHCTEHPKAVMIQMKNHLAWYTEGIGESSAMRDRIVRCHDVDGIEAIFWECWGQATDNVEQSARSGDDERTVSEAARPARV
ncbi:tRNA dihydrouridine synthase DusB [bacterium]|nr:tRNA dihydrouridine synthase DusB [bacterium]